MHINQLIPSLDWIKNYKQEHLKGDISAGLTVGIMLIPQGMAYAIIAGMPPVYGLYAALIPILIYAVLGTSRQLAVGPVAMDSLLVAAGVSLFAKTGSDNYISLAILLAFMVGAIQFLFGVFRLGFLVNFLSKPVISGFTSAAAVIIGLSQLKHLIGITLPKTNQIQHLVVAVYQNISQIHWLTVGIGIVAIVLIKGVKKIHKSLPAPLVVVVLGILAVWGLNLVDQGIKIVGNVPDGLPTFSLPNWTMMDIQNLFPIALTIALVAFMEAISVSKAVQAKHKDYEIDANKELIALGMANLVGSFFKIFPVTGGFSRTAVNDQAGAKTPFASIISAVLIGLTLLFLTPLFYYLPNAVLAAIIMVAVFGLIDTKYPVFLWKSKKDEFWMLLITFILTLTVGITFGIGVGVVISLAMIIFRTTQPHIAELGRIPNTNEFRNINRFNEVENREDVLILRFDAQLYFANIQYFKEEIVQRALQKGNKLKFIVLKSDSINGIDASAMEQLQEIVLSFKAQGIRFVFSGVKGPVRDRMYLANFIQTIGDDNFFLDVYYAIDSYDKNEPCPNKNYVLEHGE